MPDYKDSRRALYDALKKGYDIEDSFDDFSNKLDDPSRRKALYNTVSKKYDLGDFEDYEKKIAQPMATQAKPQDVSEQLEQLAQEQQEQGEQNQGQQQQEGKEEQQNQEQEQGEQNQEKYKNISSYGGYIQAAKDYDTKLDEYRLKQKDAIKDSMFETPQEKSFIDKKLEGEKVANMPLQENGPWITFGDYGRQVEESLNNLAKGLTKDEASKEWASANFLHNIRLQQSIERHPTIFKFLFRGNTSWYDTFRGLFDHSKQKGVEIRDALKMSSAYAQQSILNALNQEDLHEQAINEAHRLGIDPQLYSMAVAKRAVDDLGTELMNKMIEDKMPKNFAEWLVDNISTSALGMLFCALTETKEDFMARQMAMQLYQEQNNYGLGREILGEIVSFAGDAPLFIAGGAGGGAIADAVLGGVRLGTSALVLNSSLIGRTALFATRGALTQGFTFTALDATKEGLRQAVMEEKFSPSKMGEKALGGLATGLSTGAVGGAYSAATAKVAGIPKIFSTAAGVGIEGTSFALAGSAIEGEDLPSWNDLLKSSVFMGLLKITPKVKDLAHPKQSYLNAVAFWTGNAKANLPEGSYLTKENIRQLKENGITLTELAEGARLKYVKPFEKTEANKGEVGAKKIEDPEREKAAIKKYEEDLKAILDNPNIDYELKVKVAMSIPGMKVENLPPMGPISRQEGSFDKDKGQGQIIIYDANGNRIKTMDFTDEKKFLKTQTDIDENIISDNARYLQKVGTPDIRKAREVLASQGVSQEDIEHCEFMVGDLIGKRAKAINAWATFQDDPSSLNQKKYKEAYEDYYQAVQYLNPEERNYINTLISETWQRTPEEDMAAWSISRAYYLGCHAATTRPESTFSIDVGGGRVTSANDVVNNLARLRELSSDEVKELAKDPIKNIGAIQKEMNNLIKDMKLEPKEVERLLKGEDIDEFKKTLTPEQQEKVDQYLEKKNQLQSLRDLSFAEEMFQGVNLELQYDANANAATLLEELHNNNFIDNDGNDTGEWHEVTLRQDGSTQYITRGNIVTRDDGSIDVEHSDDIIFTYNPEKGSEGGQEAHSANDFESVKVYSKDDVNRICTDGANKLRANLQQRNVDLLNGTVHFNPGDEYAMRDRDGNNRNMRVVGQAVDEQGQPIEGVFIMTDGYGNDIAMTDKAIQAQVDAFNKARLVGDKDNIAEGDKVSLIYNGERLYGEVTEIEGDGEVYHVLTDKGEIQATIDELTKESSTMTPEQAAEEKPQEGEAPAETQTPLEQATNPQVTTALEKIPVDDKGNRLWTQAPDVPTCFDALVEFAKGNEKKALEVANVKLEDAQAELEKAQKASTKKLSRNKSVEELFAELDAKEEAVKNAEKEVAFWRDVLKEPQRRKEEAEKNATLQAGEGASQDLEGVPDILNDTPAGYQARGKKNVSGIAIVRQKPIEKIAIGKETQVQFTNEKDKNPIGNLALIEADQLQPSHLQGRVNHKTFLAAQPKDRTTDISAATERKYAKDIDPSKVTGSENAYLGSAPIVNERGEVIQGNNRSGALKLMYDEYPESVEKYKAYLKEHAEEFGLKPEDIDKFEKPILVNRVKVSDKEAAVLGAYKAEDIETGGKRRIRSKETLMKMSEDDQEDFVRRLFTPIENNPEATLAELVNQNGEAVLDFLRNNHLITDDEYASAFEEGGRLTAEAKEDIKNILVESIFEGDEWAKSYVDSSKFPVKAQRAILATAFRDLRIDDPEQKLVPEIRNAIRAFDYLMNQSEDFAKAKNVKDARAAIENWLRTQDAFDNTQEKISNFALELAALFKGAKQTEIQDKLSRIYDLVVVPKAGDQLNMFNEGGKSLDEAIKEVLGLDYERQKRGGLLGSNDAGRTTWEPGSTGNPGTGESKPKAEESTDNTAGTSRLSQQERTERIAEIDKRLEELQKNLEDKELTEEKKAELGNEVSLLEKEKEELSKPDDSSFAARIPTPQNLRKSVSSLTRALIEGRVPRGVLINPRDKQRRIENVGKEIKKQYKGFPVVVLGSYNALLKEAARQGNGQLDKVLMVHSQGKVIDGWAHDNTTYIYLPDILELTGDEDAAVTYANSIIWHEGMAHIGLKNMLGEEKFNRFCERVYRSLDPEVQQRYLAYQWDTNYGYGTKAKILSEAGINKPATVKWEDLPIEDRNKVFLTKAGNNIFLRAADEYVAHFAQKIDDEGNLPTEETDLWQKACDWFNKRIFGNKGNYLVSDQDIAKALRQSYKHMSSLDGTHQSLSHDEDVDNVRFMVREDLSSDPLLESVATKYYKAAGGSLAEDIAKASTIEELNEKVDQLAKGYKNALENAIVRVSKRAVRSEFEPQYPGEENFPAFCDLAQVPVTKNGVTRHSIDELGEDELTLVKGWIANALQDARDKIIENWEKGLQSASPAEKYIVYRTLLRECQEEAEVSPITFLQKPYEATLKQLRESKDPTKFDFYTAYTRNVVNTDIEDAGQETIEVTSSDPSQKSGKWVRFPRRGDHSQEETETIMAMVAAASMGTDWCTRYSGVKNSGANEIINYSNHDAYFFFPNGEAAKILIVPVREGEEGQLYGWYSGIFKETNGKENEIDPEYLDAVAELYRKTKNEDLKHTLEYLHCDDASIDKKKEVFAEKEQEQLSWLNDHSQERFTQDDVENIRGRFGIVLRPLKDGYLLLPTFDSTIYGKVMMGARDQFFTKLFNSIKVIEGDLNTTDAQIPTLGSVERIGGNAILTKAKFETLGNLKQVKGNLNLSGSKVTSLGELEYVGGDLNIDSSKVKDLGKLQSIKGNAIFKNSRLTSLGENLEEILGNADFSFSNVTDFGQLKEVDGNLNLRGQRARQKKGKNAQEISLGNIHIVKGDVDLRDNSAIESLGDLAIIGGDLNMEGSALKTLSHLHSVDGDVIFGENLEDMGELASIGGRDNLESLSDALQQKYKDNVEARERAESLSEVAQKMPREGDLFDDDSMFSSRQQRIEERRSRLARERQDLSEKEREDAIAFLEKIPSKKVSQAAFDWFAKKAINLKEDMKNVIDAVDVAGKAHVDPNNFVNPMALLMKHGNFKPTEQPIDPDTLPCLKDKKELPEGITVYTIDAPKWNGEYEGEGEKQLSEIEDAQYQLRHLLDTHLGKNCNPWCLLAGDGEGGMDDNAMYHWNNYNGYPKQIAFQNGKVLAFSASSDSQRLWWNRIDEEYEDGIPFEKKMPGDPLHRKEEYVMNPNSGRISGPVRIFKGDKRNGLYQEWWDKDHIREKTYYKKSKMNGLSIHYDDEGYVIDQGEYLDDEAVGEHLRWWNHSEGDGLMFQDFYDDKGKPIKASRTWFEEGGLERYVSHEPGQRKIYLEWDPYGELDDIVEKDASDKWDGLSAHKKYDGPWEGSIYKDNQKVRKLTSQELMPMLAERMPFIDKVYNDNQDPNKEPKYDYDELKLGDSQEETSEDIPLFSVRERREKWMKRLDNNRPDMTPKQKEDLITYLLKDVNDYKLSEPAFNWFVKGGIELPKDLYKVEQAIDVAKKAKANPMDKKFNSPMDVFKEYPKIQPSLKPIDPDTVRTLRNKRDVGGGVTIYDVSNTEKSRENMRKIIDTHFGVNANPWCLLARDWSNEGKFTHSSHDYWYKDYNNLPKKVAFKNGKLLAFMATGYNFEEWWDRQDHSSRALKITKEIPGDPLGRSATFEYVDQDGTWNQTSFSFKGDKQNGLYREWDYEGDLIRETHYKGGKKDGEEKIYSYKTLESKLNYKNGEFDGVQEYYFDNGRRRRRVSYKNGLRDGLEEEWYENGNPKLKASYKDDLEQGVKEEWYENENLKFRANYEHGLIDGLMEDWYENNNPKIRIHFKGGLKNGLQEEWYENGNPKAKEYFKDDKKEGVGEHWYENKQLLSKTIYKNGIRNGINEYYYDNGQIERRVNLVNGKAAEGLYSQEWYKDGDKKTESTYHEGVLFEEEWYPGNRIKSREKRGKDQVGFTETYFEDGHIKSSMVKDTEDVQSSRQWSEKEGHNLIFEKVTYPNNSRGITREFYVNGNPKKYVFFDNETKEEIRETYNDKGDLTYREALKNNIYDGLQLLQDENGNILRKATVINGKQEGEQLARVNASEDFQIYTYKNDKRVGLQQETYLNGRKERRYYLNEDGQEEGPYEKWSKDGHPLLKVNYKNGLADGLCEEWFPDSDILRKKCIMHNGHNDGPYQDWNRDGDLCLQGYCVDGQMHGVWYERDIGINGSPIMRKNIYDHGKLVQKGVAVQKVPDISFDTKEMDPSYRNDILFKIPQKVASSTANIPREMDLFDESMFSSRSKAERRAEMTKRLNTSYPSLTETQKEAVVNYFDSLETSKLRTAAFNWFLKYNLRIPQETDLARYAIKLLESKADVEDRDISNWDSPFDIVEKYGRAPEDEPTNPDTLPFLIDRKEYPEGLAVYTIDEDNYDSEDVRKSLRKVIDTHWGPDANPWCLLAKGGDGELSSSSWDYWHKTYTSYPKRIAFQNGKLLAFSANNNPNLAWWNRVDTQCPAVPGEKKVPGDPLKRKAMYYFYEDTGTWSDEPVYYFKGDKKNGLYEEWCKNSIGELLQTVKANYRKGKKDGLCEEWIINGRLRYKSHEANYKEGKVDGKLIDYYNNGQKERELNYKEGIKEGEQIYYHPNGRKSWQYTVKNGLKFGESQEWYDKGNIKERCFYNEFGELEGEFIANFEDGKPHERGRYVDGRKDGEWKIYDMNSPHALWSKENYKDGNLVGLQEEYFTTPEDEGKIQSRAYYDEDGERHGLTEYFFDNGNHRRITFYQHGKKQGPQKIWYEGGHNLKGECFYDDGELNGEYKTYWINGNTQIDCFYDHGVLIRENKQYNQGGRLTNRTVYDEKGHKLLREEYNTDNILIFRAEYYPNASEQVKKLEEFYYDGSREYVNFFNEGGSRVGHWQFWYDNQQLKAEYFYENGHTVGEAREFHKNGRPRSITRYDDLGRMHGLCEEWDEDGRQQYQGEYNHGEKEGVHQAWLEGHLRESSEWKHGLKDGSQKKWNEFDKLTQDIQYKDGKIDGLFIEYDDDGNIKYKAEFKKDKKDGVQEYYYDNNRLYSRGRYVNNLREGKWESFYENGRKRDEQNYQNDELEGESIRYYEEDGSIEFISYFKKGELIYVDHYDDYVNRNDEIIKREHFDPIEHNIDTISYLDRKNKRPLLKEYLNEDGYVTSRVMFDENGEEVEVTPSDDTMLSARQRDERKSQLLDSVKEEGLQSVFGQRHNQFLDDIYKNSLEDVRREISSLASKNGWNFYKATEEYLRNAILKDNYKEDERSWNLIRRSFNTMLKDSEQDELAGYGYESPGALSDNEIRYMIARSFDVAGGDNSILSKARDVELLNRTGMDSMFAAREKKKQEKSLVGVHNISLNFFLRAMNLGSFINPSIAVYNPNDYDHKSYGEISLIMPYEKLNARAGRNAGTWLGDAWTPTFPNIIKRDTDKGYKKFLEDLEKDVPQEMQDYVRQGYCEWKDDQKMDIAMPYFFLCTEKHRKPKIYDQEYETAFNAQKTVFENPRLKKEYDVWLLSLDGRYDLSDHLYNGYTSMGNRSIIKATPRNISRKMKERGRAGANGYNMFFNDLKNIVLSRVISTKDIKKEEHRLLGDTNDEKIKDFYEYWSNVMGRLGEKLGNGDIHDLFGGYEFLVDMVRSGNPRAYYEKYGKREGRKFSEDDFLELDHMIQAIRDDLPAAYFETKFERPVTLDEFKVAVVPRYEARELAPYLQRAGVKMVTYKDEDDRQQKVIEASRSDDDIMFSSRSTEDILSNVKYQKSPYVKISIFPEDLFGDTMFSTRKKREKEWMDCLRANRPDMSEQEKSALIKYVGDFKDGMLRNATFYWFIKGKIRLPNEMEKVKQAVEIAKKGRFEPQEYDSPDMLIWDNKDIKPKGKRIDPDKVPTLSNKKDLGGGITVYDVDNSDLSRENMRQIINTHWGPQANPWCLLEGDGKGNLVHNTYWMGYNGHTKRVAFLNGRLLAFCADTKQDADKETWYDRMDNDFEDGVPFTMPINDGSGRIGSYVWDVKEKKWVSPRNIYKGNKQNGPYEEWWNENQKHIECNYKDGEKDGQYNSWYENGKPEDQRTYKDGKLDGLVLSWWSNGNPREQSFYKNGSHIGEYKTWYQNGNPSVSCARAEDGYTYIGPYRTWYENGNPKADYTYAEDGNGYIGPYRTWYENGNPEEFREHNKNGFIRGEYRTWYENGNPKREITINDKGLTIGSEIEYYENGKPRHQTIRNENGRTIEEKDWYYFTGELRWRMRYEDHKDYTKISHEEWHENSQKVYENVFLQYPGGGEKTLIYKSWDKDGNELYNEDYAKERSKERESDSESDSESDTEELMFSARDRKFIQDNASKVLRGVKNQKRMSFIQEEAFKPLEDEAMFSAENRRQKWMNRLNNDRPDMTEAQKLALLDYIDGLDKNNTIKNATFDWFVKGTVKLDEDLYKIEDAVDVAKKAKVDPSKYISPMALLEDITDFKPSKRPIDPDTVSTLRNKQDIGYGVTVYDVDESEESRINMRKIIDTHFGYKANPWCLLAADKDGKLTKESKKLWEHYNAYPKKVAFQNGKLLAFSANERLPWWDRDDEDDDWLDDVEHNSSNDSSSNVDIAWWDRIDGKSDGIPLTLKLPNDPLGRKAEYELHEDTKELSGPYRVFKGGRKNGVITEWFVGTDQIKREIHYKDGKRDGEEKTYYANGNIWTETTWKDDEENGLQKTFYDDGNIHHEINYVNGQKNGPYKRWYQSGRKAKQGTYKNNLAVGKWETWYEDGHKWVEEEYDSRGRLISEVDYYQNGQKSIEKHYDNEGRLLSKDYGLWDKDGNSMFSARQLSPAEVGERMALAMQGLSEGVRYAAGQRENARKNISARLEDIRKMMASQREYDRSTLKKFTYLVNDMLRGGVFDAATRGDLERMVSAIGNVLNGSSWEKTDDKTFQAQVDKLFDIAVRAQLSSAKKELEDVLKVKATKENAKGVTVMGKMDVRGQRVHKKIKEYIEKKFSLDTLSSMQDELTDDLASENDMVREDAEIRYQAIQIAKEYAQGYLKKLEEETAVGERLKTQLLETPKEMHQGMKDFTHETLRKSQLERAQCLQTVAQMIRSEVVRGVLGARDFRESQQEQAQRVLHGWNKDMRGRSAKAHRKDTRVQRMANNSILRFFLNPLLSFDMMLRMVGNKSINGEGYTYDRFGRGWHDCNDQEFRSKRQATDELDKRVSEIFGKKMRFSELYKYTRDASKGIDVRYFDDGLFREGRLNPGNMMYIYMANKMLDGKMKLRYMGISEEDVERIKEALDPRLVDLADWIQNDFLVRQREKYNKVHERMFGASMANIDDYFPLKILSNARQEKVDMTGVDTEALPATMTGAIITRTVNSLPLDVTGTDALDVVIEHLDQMEHWAAFAEYNRDLCTLLTYKRARNQLKNMASVYGAGELLWQNFKDCAYMAGGAYIPKTSGRNSADNIAVNLAKGVTGAKIALRLFTAAKQILSSPAFVGQAGVVEICESLNPWRTCKWAMESLPGFSKRWLSRQAGDTRLMQTESDWEFWKNEIVQKIGRFSITPNAAVDALTVAIGARAVYLTKKRKYMRQGISEKEAEIMALQDAATAYNQSQQSSESIFIAPMQVDRSFLNVGLTVFRNASMAYTRGAIDAGRNLVHLIVGGTNYRDELIYNYTKKLESHGVAHDKAKAEARREYLKSWSHNLIKEGVFAFGLEFLWNMAPHLLYYLFGKDDDKKRDYLIDDLTHGLLGTTEGFAMGDRITSVISGLVRGQGLRSIANNLDFDFLPAISDINTISREVGYDKWRGLNDFICLLVQANVGVNPSTLTDVAVAIMDGCQYDIFTAREVAALLARIAQFPQSSLDDFYFDEIDMSGADAKKLTPSQMAKRYALYKAKRAAFLTSPLYSDDEWEKATGRFENVAKKKSKEFIGTVGNDTINNRYLEYEERYKQYKAKQDTISALKKENKEEYKRQWNAWKNSKEYQFMKDFKVIEGHLKEHVDSFLNTNDPRIAKLAQDSVQYDKKTLVNYMDSLENKNNTK